MFEAVRARVAAGEHLDSMPGLPGADRGTGSVFGYGPDGRMRRIFQRREPGFRAARDSGRIPPLPPLTPAAPEALHRVEEAVGAVLPALFRRCYLELGNGGFGPGNGLLPAPTGSGPEPETLHDDQFSNRRGWLVSGSLLLICHWGCGIASLIDVRDPDGPMWAIDPHGPNNPSDALFQQDLTFTEWLGRWAEGVLDQPDGEQAGHWDEPTAAAPSRQDAEPGPWHINWTATG